MSLGAYNFIPTAMSDSDSIPTRLPASSPSLSSLPSLSQFTTRLKEKNTETKEAKTKTKLLERNQAPRVEKYKTRPEDPTWAYVYEPPE